MAAISQQFYRMQDPGHVAVEPSTLEDAIVACEGAALPLKVMHTRAIDSAWATGDRLNALHTGGKANDEGASPRRWLPPHIAPRGSLDDAVAYCEGAVDPLEARIQEAERVLAEEQRKRQEAEARLVRATRIKASWAGSDSGATGSDFLYTSTTGGPASHFLNDDEPAQTRIPEHGPDQHNCKNMCVVA